MKIGLDGTVFKNRKFIDWLIYNKNFFKLHIPELVYFETLQWKRLNIGKEIMYKSDGLWQFIHQQPEHIIRLPYHICFHQSEPGPANLGNYNPSSSD